MENQPPMKLFLIISWQLENWKRHLSKHIKYENVAVQPHYLAGNENIQPRYWRQSLARPCQNLVWYSLSSMTRKWCYIPTAWPALIEYYSLKLNQWLPWCPCVWLASLPMPSVAGIILEAIVWWWWWWWPCGLSNSCGKRGIPFPAIDRSMCILSLEKGEAWKSS